MHRSPSLERLMHAGRQARSCPGSRLPSPRGSSQRPGMKEVEAVSSQASTVDTAEAMVEESSFPMQCQYDGVVNLMPSVHTAAWQDSRCQFEPLTMPLMQAPSPYQNYPP